MKLVVLDDVGKEIKEQKHRSTFEGEEMGELHVLYQPFFCICFWVHTSMQLCSAETRGYDVR